MAHSRASTLHFRVAKRHEERDGDRRQKRYGAHSSSRKLVVDIGIQRGLVRHLASAAAAALLALARRRRRQPRRGAFACRSPAQALGDVATTTETKVGLAATAAAVAPRAVAVMVSTVAAVPRWWFSRRRRRRFMAAVSAVAARPFTAVVSEAVGWRSTVAVFVGGPSFMAADTASYIVTRSTGRTSTTGATSTAASITRRPITRTRPTIIRGAAV